MRIRSRVVASKGTTVHYVDDKVVACPSYLEIEQDGEMFFLLRLNEHGQCIADTCHTSLNEAKSQAEFEYVLPTLDRWEA